MNAEPVRIREIPYNYTSFSDREIVIRLLGEQMWAVSGTSCAPSASPAAPRACCSRCWATSGWWRAIPISRTTCSRIRAAAPRWSGRMRHRLDADRGAPRRATPLALQLTRGARARGACGRIRQRLRRRRRTAPQACAAQARRASRARDNIDFDGLARVSHVTDATDWRVEYPFVVISPGQRGRSRRGGAGLHRARPDHHPARRRHRLYRRRHAAAPRLGGHQYREAGSSRRVRADGPAGLGRSRSPTVRCGAGVVTARVMERGRSGRSGLRGGPDLGRMPPASAAMSP